MLNFIRKKINIPEEKFYIFIEKVGNTVSSTIPIALKEIMENNNKSESLLLAGFGVGYSWAGVTLNKSK
jgi:3-oxoacyl-[acyl-carrier-protein] synthase-3